MKNEIGSEWSWHLVHKFPVEARMIEHQHGVVEVKVPDMPGCHFHTTVETFHDDVVIHTYAWITTHPELSDIKPYIAHLVDVDKENRNQ